MNNTGWHEHRNPQSSRVGLTDILLKRHLEACSLLDTCGKRRCQLFQLRSCGLGRSRPKLQPSSTIEILGNEKSSLQRLRRMDPGTSDSLFACSRRYQIISTHIPDASDTSNCVLLTSNLINTPQIVSCHFDRTKRSRDR